MAKVRTIRGDVDPGRLGITYTHEHLVCFPPDVAMREDFDYQLPSVERAIEELKRFRDSGGGCLVEGTAIDYGRDVRALAQIAGEIDVHVVFCTGFNKGRFHPDWVRQMSVEELADLMEKEIIEGVEPTGEKAGYIKVGSWYNVITESEERVTRAAARVQRRTGAPVWVHTEAGTMGLEQLDILEQEGADLTKVCIGHSDRNPDFWYHKKMLERGAYLGYDGPGKVKYFPDSVRVDLMRRIFDSGYGRQLLVSGDMGRRSYLKAYGGGPGFEYILTKFIPRLIDEGFSKEEIDRIWIENPARWLAF